MSRGSQIGELLGVSPEGARPDTEAAAERALALVRERLFGAANRFGRYRVIRTLGSGAMGVVYEAHDPQLGRRVALKVVKLDEEASSAAGSQHLLREAQALARLSHPNVVPVFDVGNVDGDVFVAMEYVAGGTLSDWMKGGDRSWREVLAVFGLAGRGLEAAHEQGIVHRDFKPANVLVGSERGERGVGRVCVADFGLARLEAAPQDFTESPAPVSETARTATGLVVGTPPYMAPEQHRGEAPSARSDQYAFCVALHEALYGRRPFVAGTLRDLYRLKLEGIPTEPPLGDIPDWVYRAIRRGVHSDPARRWPSMTQLLATLSDSSVGRYDLVKRLARGGMADLFVARATGIGDFEKYVVLKRILPHLADDPEFTRMFVDEARLAATLDHPNIVQVYDIGKDGEDHYFTMEYVHGEDLEGLLWQLRDREEALPLQHAIAIGVGVCAGLHHAHERGDASGRPLGIVHRDVSPTNILVSYDGAVKIADFGIAKIAARSRVTKAGTRKGKASYMSPEQVEGKPVDRRSDVFAIGILLFEMTTGTRLFDGENELAIMRRIADVDAPAPEGVDPELRRIILKALARDRTLRYPTALDLQLDLERYAAEARCPPSTAALAAYLRGAIGVKPYPWAGEVGPGSGSLRRVGPVELPTDVVPAAAIETPPRRLPVVAIAVGVVAALGIGIGVGSNLSDPAAPAPTSAPARQTDAPPPAAAAAVEAAPAPAPATKEAPPPAEPAPEEPAPAAVAEEPEVEAAPAKPAPVPTRGKRRRAKRKKSPPHESEPSPRRTPKDRGHTGLMPG